MTQWVSSFPEAEERRSRAIENAARRRKWVPGSELTSAELARIQPTLKQDFYEREERRAA